MEQQLLHPASFSLVDALCDDPFYRTISVRYEDDPALRRARLAEYFSYCLDEARIRGRCVQLDDRSLGAAAWLLPIDERCRREASVQKVHFLEQCLGVVGRSEYEAIVRWMNERSAPYVQHAWYLSIVGVAPQAQRRGLGRQLLAPTLAEADAAHAHCYLETFTPRNTPFYERLGFRALHKFLEPTTGSEYYLMLRHPGGIEQAGEQHAGSHSEKI